MSLKILIDENLPQTLLARLGVGTVHATALGERLSDTRLWDYAREHHCVILTKDADFFDRLSLGNLRRSAMEDQIQRQWPAVLALLEKSDLVEIHADRIEGVTFGP